MSLFRMRTGAIRGCSSRWWYFSRRLQSGMGEYSDHCPGKMWRLPVFALAFPTGTMRRREQDHAVPHPAWNAGMLKTIWMILNLYG